MSSFERRIFYFANWQTASNHAVVTSFPESRTLKTTNCAAAAALRAFFQHFWKCFPFFFAYGKEESKCKNEYSLQTLLWRSQVYFGNDANIWLLSINKNNSSRAFFLGIFEKSESRSDKNLSEASIFCARHYLQFPERYVTNCVYLFFFLSQRSTIYCIWYHACLSEAKVKNCV